LEEFISAVMTDEQMEDAVCDIADRIRKEWFDRSRHLSVPRANYLARREREARELREKEEARRKREVDAYKRMRRSCDISTEEALKSCSTVLSREGKEVCCGNSTREFPFGVLCDAQNVRGEYVSYWGCGTAEWWPAGIKYPKCPSVIGYNKNHLYL
jgi:hypothetical protein